MGMITKETAAKRLLVSERTLERMIKRGALPAYRIGPKAVRIREEDLAAYIDHQRIAPPVRQEKKAETARPCRYVPGMTVV